MADTRTYRVPDVSCDHCKHAIESEVGALSDVEHVVVDIEGKAVTVTGSAAEPDVHAAIRTAGYEVAEA